MHLGHGIAFAALLGLIAFAFGERVARTCVAIMLLVGGAFFAYVAALIVTGAI